MGMAFELLLDLDLEVGLLLGIVPLAAVPAVPLAVTPMVSTATAGRISAVPLPSAVPAAASVLLLSLLVLLSPPLPEL